MQEPKSKAENAECTEGTVEGPSTGEENVSAGLADAIDYRNLCGKHDSKLVLPSKERFLQLFKRWPKTRYSSWKDVVERDWPKNYADWVNVLILPPDLAKRGIQRDINKGQVATSIVGRITPDRFMPLKEMLFIYQKISYDHDSHPQSIIFDALLRHISPWRELPFYVSAAGALQFELRALQLSEDRAGMPQACGFPIERELGRCFDQANGKNSRTGFLRETRITLALTQEYMQGALYYSVFYLSDPEDVLFPLNWFISEQYLSKPELLPGLRAFLKCIDIAFEAVNSGWDETITLIEENLRLSLTEITDSKTREALLFDDDGFSKSKLYFEGLQLLRVCEEWVDETRRDLLKLPPGISGFMRDIVVLLSWHPGKFFPLSDSHMSEIDDECGRVIERIVTQLDAILGRIKSQRDMVEGLRNGLYSATAVREARLGYELSAISKDLATKSTELAQISTDLAESNTRMARLVLIFTVMTVIYLPLGFVTGFFGMNNFNDNYLVSNMSAFAVMLPTTAIITYIAAGAGYYVFMVRGKKQERKRKKAMDA